MGVQVSPRAQFSFLKIYDTLFRGGRIVVRKNSREKFLEILEQHNIPVDNLETTTVVLHRFFGGGKITYTLYGVGQPIPLPVMDAITSEVFPLIRKESPGAEIIVSKEMLPLGEPARRQSAWNAHCAMFHL